MPPHPEREASVISCKVGIGRLIGIGALRNETSVQISSKDDRSLDTETCLSLAPTVVLLFIQEMTGLRRRRPRGMKEEAKLRIPTKLSSWRRVRCDALEVSRHRDLILMILESGIDRSESR